MPPLVQIENRVREMVRQRGEWPCHKGCDLCCRRLADIPQLTLEEWNLMRDAVAALPAEVHQRIRTLRPDRPVTCPLLDPSSGACLIYDVRPVACRAYGFYVERHEGLYCAEIAEAVDRGEFAGTIWGNWESVAPRGETRNLVEWFLPDQSSAP